MPLSLSSITIAEKNKLSATSVFLIALKITIPGVGTPARVVDNNEDITWAGETWVKTNFNIAEIKDQGKGEIPQVNLTISNVSRVIEGYLHAFDIYQKTNGYSPIVVNIYVLNTLDLASGTPVAEWELELKQPKTDSQYATFILSAENPFGRRFPQGRIMKNHCRAIYQGGFKGALCGYAGAETECDGTLETCRSYGNNARFGGNPGVGMRGIRFA